MKLYKCTSGSYARLPYDEAEQRVNYGGGYVTIMHGDMVEVTKHEGIHIYYRHLRSGLCTRSHDEVFNEYFEEVT